MTRKYSSISVETTLASGISSTATSMTVATGAGSALMGGVTLAVGNVDQFTVALDVDTQNEEIVFVTAVNGDTLTIVRARAGSSGITHSGGATVKHVLTSDDLNYYTTGVDSSVTAAGTLTLTNKTIALGSNTVSGTTAQFNTALTDNNFATLAGAETLTNKTLSSSVLTGSVTAGGGVGTNGQVLSSTGSGVQWSTLSGSNGLTLIQTTTFTAAATLNISSVFSSTYSNYRVVCNLKGATAGTTVTLRMLTGTTTADSTANYNGSFTETTSAGATSVTAGLGATSMNLGTLFASAGNFFGSVFDFIGPNIVQATNALYQGSMANSAPFFVTRTGGFTVNTITQYTGFQLNSSTGNLEGGTISVYGYNN